MSRRDDEAGSLTKIADSGKALSLGLEKLRVKETNCFSNFWREK